MNPGKKRKIGILTIHAALNFGSMLQAYALQSTVESLAPDCHVEVIDYLPAIIMSPYSSDIRAHLHSPVSLAKYMLSRRQRVERILAFQRFSDKHLHLSDRTFRVQEELSSASSNWDACILGSDQVWNPAIVGEDRAFFLDFFGNGFKASFASSFGSGDVDASYLAALCDSLSSFRYIAVREPSAAKLLNVPGTPVFVSCDPVFLLSAQQWRKLASKPVNIPKQYILYYSVERNKSAEKLVLELSERYKLPVVDAGSRNNPFGYIGIHPNQMGPSEFLYLVDHAEYMVTNSFHGTAFGTIFEKKCISMLHSTRGTRIRELAQLSGRDSYIVGQDTSLDQIVCLLDQPVICSGNDLAYNITASMDYLETVVKDVAAEKE